MHATEKAAELGSHAYLHDPNCILLTAALC